MSIKCCYQSRTRLHSPKRVTVPREKVFFKEYLYNVDCNFQISLNFRTWLTTLRVSACGNSITLPASCALSFVRARYKVPNCLLHLQLRRLEARLWGGANVRWEQVWPQGSQAGYLWEVTTHLPTYSGFTVLPEFRYSHTPFSFIIFILSPLLLLS